MSGEVYGHLPSNDLGAGGILTSQSAGGGIFYNRHIQLSIKNRLEVGARLEFTTDRNPGPAYTSQDNGTFKEKFSLSPMARLSYSYYFWQGFGVGPAVQAGYSSQWGEKIGVQTLSSNQTRVTKGDDINRAFRVRGGAKIHVLNFIKEEDGFHPFNLQLELGVDHMAGSISSNTGFYMFFGASIAWGKGGKTPDSP